MASDTAVKKAVIKLQKSLLAGQAYEGQQTIKTTYHRLRSRKRLIESYQLLEEGALLQLQQGQVTCGSELGSTLVEAFQIDKVVANDQAVLQILRILQAFPGAQREGTDDVPKLCCKLGLDAVSWAKQYPLGDLALQQDTAGSPEQQIHNHLARYLWDCYGPAGLGWASLHFAHGSEPFRFAAAVAAAAEQALEAELDLFVVRACLQILGTSSKHCLQYCAEFQQAFKGICEQSHRGLTMTPLHNFLGLLQEALAQQSLPLVQLLRSEYNASLASDHGLLEMLEQVISRHFGVSSGGVMNSLFSRMFDMLNSDAVSL